MQATRFTNPVNPFFFLTKYVDTVCVDKPAFVIYGESGVCGRQRDIENTEVPMPDKQMSRYQSPCEKYTYDPEAGDFERNIPPGTPFEDLPDDWCCPECGAEKEYFEELDD